MTRIIAGLYRGRRLDVPEGRDIRPTTDRMRERLFSMLTHARYPDMVGARVLDLFAGTGALGLEALSRGAAHVTFAEQARASLACVKGNIAALKVQADCTVMPLDASKLPPTKEAFDFIFMDPPYRQGLVAPTLASILAGGWLASGAVIICELAVDDGSELPAGLQVLDDRKQGQQRVIFLTHQ